MSTSPLIGVLALQGDVPEHLDALDASGARAVRVRRPSEVDGLEGLLLPGGESTTIGKLAAAYGLLDPIRSAIADGLPVYGSCAGMILLADRLVDGTAGQQTVGGIDMTVRRNAFGRQVDSFETDLAFAELGTEPVHTVFIRAPWVEQAGAGVEVLARTPARSSQPDQPEGAADRIVAVRQGALLATSFHPELTGDTRVHALFVSMVRERS